MHGDLNPSNIILSEINGRTLPIIVDTDGLVERRAVPRYGLLFMVGELDHDYLDKIKERFESESKMAEFHDNIDCFTVI